MRRRFSAARWCALLAAGAFAAVLVAAPNANPHLATGRYLYVFPDRGLDIYAISAHHQLVLHLDLPQAHAMRGVAAAMPTQRLFLSVGGNGGANGNGSIV